MRPELTDETHEVTVTMSQVSLRRTVSGAEAAWWLAAIAVAVVATVVRPQWPMALVDALGRVGGIWRSLVLPLPLFACAWVVFVNTASTGRAWAWVHSVPSRWWRQFAVALVLAASILAVVLNVGTVTATQIVRPVVLWVLQLVLHPDTPLAALVAIVAIAVMEADRRNLGVVSEVSDAWARRSRVGERALILRIPALLAMVAGATVAGAFYPDAMQGWFRDDPPDAQKYNLYSSFFNYSISDARIVSLEGYDLGERGLMLKPGTSGAITFTLDRPPRSIALLKANFYNRRFLQKGEVVGSVPETVFSNALEVSTDRGQTYWPVFTDQSIGDVVGSEPVDLTPSVGNASNYLLRFRATNTASEPMLVLPSMVVSVVVDPLTAPSPMFPAVLWGGLLALASYVGLRRWLPRPASSWWGALVASGLILVIVYLCDTGWGLGKVIAGAFPGLVRPASTLELDLTTTVQLVLRLFPAISLVMCILAVMVRISGPREDVTTVPSLVLFGALSVFVIALGMRWETLIRVRYDFLLPDAQGYLAIAREFAEKQINFSPLIRTVSILKELGEAGYDRQASFAAVFYAGGHNGREPLWPAVIHWFASVFGFSTFHARLVSILCSSAVAFLTVLLGAYRINPFVGVVGGLLVAVNVPHVSNAIHGLREELVTCFILGLVLVTSSGHLWRPLAGDFREWFRVSIGDRWPLAGRRLEWWRLVLAGLAGAGVILVRADMVVLVAMVGGTFTAMFRWGWRTWVPIAALALGFAAPMYVGYWATQGDPFWPGTYGASVNRNLEFPERMGTPGFPSAAEYAANWAAGPLISPITYFFGYHTPMQFLQYSIAGFERIFREILFADQPVLLVLFWVGLGFSVVSGRWIIPWGIAMTLLPFYAFMAGVPNPWVFPGRYAHQALPFAALAVAWAVCGLPIIGISWFNRRNVRIARSGSGG